MGKINNLESGTINFDIKDNIPIQNLTANADSSSRAYWRNGSVYACLPRSVHPRGTSVRPLIWDNDMAGHLQGTEDSARQGRGLIPGLIPM